jgi:hypothetical protein
VYSRGVERLEGLTKAKARQIARKPRGYFRPNLISYEGTYVVCPLCRAHVGLIPRPFARQYSEPSAAELDATIVRHLTDRYDDSRCPEVASVRPGSEWKD